jgi:enterochelin esterase-like enzyme
MNRYQLHTHQLYSPQLGRYITTDLYYPEVALQPFHVLVFNDGQDAPALRLLDTLNEMADELPQLLVVGLHANHRRMREYGIAAEADYANRGDLAGAHTDFVLHTLTPWLRSQFWLNKPPAHWVIAGFSLGGLSAFDMALHHSDCFSKVGVFSGSFWWRRHGKNDPAGMIDRIMHDQIRQLTNKPPLEFWLQTGTEDETSDRNNSGIIDSIEDTLDIIAELEAKGYDLESDISYVEIEGGRHDQQTWGDVMPNFLKWAFG